MFAVLTLERDPLKLTDILNFYSVETLLTGGLFTWIQVAGAVAALCLLFYLPFRLLRGAGEPARPWMPTAFLILLSLSVLGYLGLLGIFFGDILAAFSGEPFNPSKGTLLWSRALLTVAGVCALTTVCLPFLVNLLDLRWRRIWAIARLSFKEAIRRRILYVFGLFILVLLFLNWFVNPKEEAQLQTYVEIVFHTMTPLLMVSAGIVSAFAIPTDIKQQTIHTVTTKPVERFEIVLGRVLGYSLLMTLVLLTTTTLSLFYVLRGIKPAAAEESLKARIPVYGNLDFYKVDAEYEDRETEKRDQAENVGREWDYRKYIAGQAEAKREPVVYAVWEFRDLPRNLGNRQFVRCEFNFDIYRTTKGEENAGVACSFFFEVRGWEKFAKGGKVRDEYKKLRRERGGREGQLTPDVDNELSQQYGYYEVQGKRIEDYHTLYVDVPAGLFRKAAEMDKGGPPALLVRVRCGTVGQMVGMARYDLYFRGDDPAGGKDTLAFVLNFYKGSLGILMLVVMIIALNVVISTEMGGVITFLIVFLLYAGGTAREFIQELSQQSEVTGYGGPLESAFRLFGRTSISAPLEETTLTKVAVGSDAVFRFFVQGLLQILPDPDRFSFTDRVANGFNVGLIQQDLLPTFLYLLGYLFPWGLLAFYLIRSREIAGAH